jgi:hypothetical protein
MVFRTLSKVLQIFLTVLDNIFKPFLSLSPPLIAPLQYLPRALMASNIIIAGTNQAAFQCNRYILTYLHSVDRPTLILINNFSISISWA